MRDGIYKVTFSASSGDLGDGMIVIKGSSVNGADHGYLYLGSIERTGSRFAVRLTIRRWDPKAYSVFGPIEEFTLAFAGVDTHPDRFEAKGEVPERPFETVGVYGRFLSDCA